MLQAQMTNSLFVDSKQWKKCKVIKVKKKKMYKMKQLGGFIFSL